MLVIFSKTFAAEATSDKFQLKTKDRSTSESIGEAMD